MFAIEYEPNVDVYHLHLLYVGLLFIRVQPSCDAGGTSVFAGPSSVIEEIRSRFGDIATKQGSCQLLAGAEDASLVSVPGLQIRGLEFQKS